MKNSYEISSSNLTSANSNGNKATPTDFCGKVAIVTGSNSGIGEATALNLARRGASVTLCGRNVPRLEESLQKCINASGGHTERFMTCSGDVNDQQFRTQIIESTVTRFGQLDILVCNAGTVHKKSSIDLVTEESFDLTVDTMAKSVVFLIQTALPYLEKSKGNIISISSVCSVMPSPAELVYAMTKAAVDHMTRILALDLGPRGIRVNGVRPSYAMTRLIRDESGERKDKPANSLGEMEKTKQPLGSRLVTVEEVAESIVFLASDSASFITGQVLSVDGGRVLAGPFGKVN